MTLPAALAGALAGKLNAPVEHAQPAYGGDINQATRFEAGGKLYFVKWNANAPPAMFPAEAHGLRLLAQAGAIRIPKVIAQGDATGGCPAYLLLEFIETGGERLGRDSVMRDFGEELASLHHNTASVYGLDQDNFIGRLTQPNPHTASWVEFYGKHRLGHQMDLARKRGRLPRHRDSLLTRLIERLPDLLKGVDVVPSLLHGDLWGGNYLVDEHGQAVLIDPAVYYGHREMDLAMTELFGGFSDSFYTAYNAAYPLHGYAERRSLYQLYYILAHLNLFGESYGGRVDSLAAYYVGW